MNSEIKLKIERWIQQINDESAVPPGIVAFNFGLFESEDGYCIYLIGSNAYDEDDDDWACEVDYEPKYKYLPLLEVSRQEIGWEEFQNKVKDIVAGFISKNADKLPMFKDKIITIGFDDGNLIRIW